MVGVRTTLKLEAPVAMDAQRMVSPEYVEVLASMSSRMFQENLERTKKFKSVLMAALAKRSSAGMSDEQRREAKKAAGLAVSRGHERAGRPTPRMPAAQACSF